MEKHCGPSPRPGFKRAGEALSARGAGTFLAAALGLAVGTGCSEADSAPPEPFRLGGGGASGVAGAGAAGGEVSLGGLGGGAGAPAGGSSGGCGLLTEQATGRPLHLYVLVDKSSSMEGANWDALTSGFAAFLAEPRSEGLVVALEFFPLHGDWASCASKPYETPAVGYSALPAGLSGLTAALAAEKPDGPGTPTYSALLGALTAAKRRAEAMPEAVSAVVLVSDGRPLQPGGTCAGSDPQDVAVIAKLASNARQHPKFPVLTYVVGLDGLDPTFGDAVALAGGSEKALMVSRSNAAASLTAAFARVRGKAVPCEYALPDEVESGAVDYEHVNVLYTAGETGGVETLLYSEDCGADAGWHYDDPASPTKILLCAPSCSRVQDDLGAKVEIKLGCKREVPR